MELKFITKFETKYKPTFTGKATKFTIYNSTLPVGLSLDGVTGEINGIPTKEGEYDVTFRAYNGESSFTEITQKLTVVRKL